MFKRIVWILVLVLAVAGLWYALRPTPTSVDVGRVTRGGIAFFVEEEGMTRVVDRFVVCAPVAGRMGRIPFDEGHPVKEGDLLTTIDPLPIKGRIREAQAAIDSLKERIRGVETQKPKPEELERARAEEEVAEGALDVAKSELAEATAALTKAELDTKRERRLLETASGTQAELDAAVAAEAQARARRSARELTLRIRTLQISTAKLNTAVLSSRLKDFEWQKADYAKQIGGIEAQLAVLEDDLKHTTVVAPMSGRILNLFEESQRVVAAGQPLLEIGDVSKLEVEADFLSEDVAHMRKGMPVEVYGRALGNEVHRGSIKRIYPSAFRKISSLGVEQQRVKVVVDLNPSLAGLRDRYRVEVRVILEEKESATLVPEGALFRHDGEWHVFRLGGGNAVLTPVKTGIRDGRMREVLEGLAEGDEVILHPDDSLEDGARVEKLPQ